MLGLPVSASVVVVAGVPEELRRETVRTDLDRDPPFARKHEALRHERPRNERQQQQGCDQPA
jgi:hypothetical protein